MLKLDYEQGLKRLENALHPGESRSRADFNLLKARLIANLDDGARYGSNDPSNHSEWARIMEGLSKLADELLGIHFVDLCHSNTTQIKPTLPKVSPTPQPLSQSMNQPWVGGAEINIQGKTYWLHDPVEEIWTSDHSVVQRCAKAQQAGTNRKVWLKQVYIFRPTSRATMLRQALMQESRLLEDIEGERPYNFPRLLNSHSTEESTSIAYTVTGGSPLTQVFGPREAPLDAFSARTLLHSLHSLYAMLDSLHRRHRSHRALTPETLLVQGGRILIQDVGLAARNFEHGEGPHLYRAPEQVPINLEAVVPGTYTDVYQLGMILYHTLTGCLPSPPLPDIPPAVWNNALSQDIYIALRKAIAPATKDRWPTIKEFAQALKQATK
jgi:serine/threonine protein kinase